MKRMFLIILLAFPLMLQAEEITIEATNVYAIRNYFGYNYELQTGVLKAGEGTALVAPGTWRTMAEFYVESIPDNAIINWITLYVDHQDINQSIIETVKVDFDETEDKTGDIYNKIGESTIVYDETNLFQQWASLANPDKKILTDIKECGSWFYLGFRAKNENLKTGSATNLRLVIDYYIPKINIIESSIEFNKNIGESQTVHVESNIDWYADIPYSCDWLQVTPTSGSNDGTLTITTIKENTGSPRNSDVTVDATDQNLINVWDNVWVVQQGNQAPEVSTSIPDQSKNEYFSSTTLNLNNYFSDPDDSNLSYSAVSSNSSVVTTSVDGATLTINEKGIGNSDISITAKDPLGKSASDQFKFTVININEKPQLISSIPDKSYNEGFESGSLSVGGYFSDPDGDNLSFTASSSNNNVVTVSVSGSTLTFTEKGIGYANITVTAKDPSNLSEDDIFKVTVNNVNEKPQLVSSISDKSYNEGFVSATLDVVSYFSDPDGDALTFTASSSNTNVVTVSVSGSTLTFTEKGIGYANITVTAKDPSNLSEDDIFKVTVNNVNEKPELVSSITDKSYNEGFGSVTLDVGSYFSDPDGDELTFTASSSDENVVTVSVSESTLTFTEKGIGYANITVTAKDPSNLSVDDVFKVTVNNVNEPAINLSTSEIQFLNLKVNTISEAKLYTLTGSSLAGDVTVTPPDGFIISKNSSSGYTSSSLNFEQSSGEVNATIYVKFCPTEVKAYSGIIVHSSSGATSVDLEVSGIGIDNECIPPSTPTEVIASDGEFCDRVQVQWNSVNGASSYNVYRGNTTTPIVTGITATTYDDVEATTTAQNYYVSAMGDCESEKSDGDSGFKNDCQQSNDFYSYDLNVEPQVVKPGENFSVIYKIAYTGTSETPLYSTYRVLYNTTDDFESATNIIGSGYSYLSKYTTFDEDTITKVISESSTATKVYFYVVSDYDANFVETDESNNVSKVVLYINQNDDPYLTVDVNEITLSSKSDASESISISSNTTWSINNSSDWFTVSPVSGDGDGTIQVTTTNANDQPQLRTGIFTISGDGVEDITVIVAQKDSCRLEIGEYQILPSNMYGSEIIHIYSNSTWDITTSPWLSANPSSGTGDTTVTIEWNENMSTTSRTGLVTVKGCDDDQILTVIQESACELNISLDEIKFEKSDSTVIMKLTSNNYWTIRYSFPTTINISPSSGEAGNDISVLVSANENNSSNPLSGSVTISNACGSEHTITLTQSDVSVGINNYFINSLLIYPNPF